MADEKQPPDKSAVSRGTAGVAGAGSGTLLVLLANNLPATSPWKSWLVIAAPSASIFAALVWNKLSTAFDLYLRKREFNDLIAHAETTLDHALRNETTSAEHKHQLKTELEQLQLLQVQTDLERLKHLRVYR